MKAASARTARTARRPRAFEAVTPARRARRLPAARARSRGPCRPARPRNRRLSVLPRGVGALATKAVGFSARRLPAALFLLCASFALDARAGALCVDLAGGEVRRYEVEVAATPRARARGLMFRRSLAPRAGMLFDFGTDQVASMWMKNTFIPLDMVFADRDGVVRGIARNARPRSLDPISSRIPVRAVLELNGGEAERIGLSAGDRLRHPVFGTRCDN